MDSIDCKHIDFNVFGLHVEFGRVSLQIVLPYLIHLLHILGIPTLINKVGVEGGCSECDVVVASEGVLVDFIWHGTPEHELWEQVDESSVDVFITFASLHFLQKLLVIIISGEIISVIIFLVDEVKGLLRRETLKEVKALDFVLKNAVDLPSAPARPGRSAQLSLGPRQSSSCIPDTSTSVRLSRLLHHM